MAATERDVRLDFFRGLGLLFIFLDHIPDNFVSYFTLANVVFCDAAEIFVFISGYSAALVFGTTLRQHGNAYAAAQILKRCWTLYVAHIFLFVLFVAQVSYTATRFDNPMFLDEMRVADFLQEPHIAVLHALALRFQPPFMDILPLYIVLLIGFAFALPLLLRRPTVVLIVALALYIPATILHFNLGTYPSGSWFFNPFSWQMIFVLGAVFAIQRDRMHDLAGRPALILLSAVFLGVCILARTAIGISYLQEMMPPALVEAIWFIVDKTNLGPVRLLNFVALVHVTVTLLRAAHPLFRSRYTEPVVLCGQNSLNVFCLGIFLSLLGHFILAEVSRALLLQFAVSAGGIMIMFGAAYFLTWSKRRRRPSGDWTTATAQPKTTLQGGE